MNEDKKKRRNDDKEEDHTTSAGVVSTLYHESCFLVLLFSLSYCATENQKLRNMDGCL